jgi:concentrative nucleoside transporter, CNT family
MPLALQSLFGFIALFAIAWAISEKRSGVVWRTVLGAIGLQVTLCIVMFKFPWFQQASLALNSALGALQAATGEGTKLLFGYLGGAELPFALEAGKNPFVLAAQALPLVIVVSALSALLFYWGILPLLVKALSWMLTRSIGVGGAVGVSSAANIFLGPVEAPLFIKPYLAKLSRGELFTVMTAGMAGIAGTVLALYASVLQPSMPDVVGHLIIASFISAPAAIAFAALLVPHEGEISEAQISSVGKPASAMDAITRGTLEGMQVFINMIAMILVLIALVALANQVLTLLPNVAGAPITLQGILGWLMAPIMWLIGIPWSEAITAGALMGTKTFLNEFFAYLDLAQLSAAQFSDRSRMMMTYALCGFANFGALGILLGGLGTLCPERRSEMVQMAYKCLFAGTLATLSCGALVGVVY